jgi:Uma2 family endonuclease
VNALTSMLTTQLSSSAIVSVQNPIVLDDYSEPQPDLVVLRPRADFYRGAHPQPADVLLLIEVADSSIEFDRHRKLPQYAKCGIPEVWIVDLDLNCVDRFDHPSPDGYEQTTRFQPGDRIGSSSLSLDIAVSDVL